MVYVYLRISTGRQTADTQRFQAERFCQERNITVDNWVCETVSGAKKAADRKLGKLVDDLQKGDTLIVTELSRLGRSFFNVMSTINTCIEKEVKIIALKGNYELGDNIQSKVIVFAFSLAAEIERDMIRARTSQAIERKRAEGKTWGRQKGFKPNSYYKLSENMETIQEELEKNTPYTTISKLTGIDRRTIAKFHSKILTDN